jgi:hypothetical protein
MPGRVKGFAPWRPQKRTEPLLADIEAVLEEYREYLPLTVLRSSPIGKAAGPYNE